MERPVELNEATLQAWCGMEGWGEYLQKRGALADSVSSERFRAIEEEYFDKVKHRIRLCEDLFKTHKSPLVCYTLAQLYNRLNPDETPEYLLKRPVRYYAILAIRMDRKYAPAWALLAEAYSWIGQVSRESQQRRLRYVERAIRCAKETLAIEPSNPMHRERLRGFYHQRNEEYKPEMPHER